MWGFRSPPGRGRPDQIALAFLSANAELLKLAGVRLKLRLVKESVGAWHVILQQRHKALRIHRAYVTVHLGRDRRVYLCKNRSVPVELLPADADFRLSLAAARLRAFRALGKRRQGVVVLDTEKLWFPRRQELRPAIKFRLHRETPRQELLIYVDAATGGSSAVTTTSRSRTPGLASSIRTR